MSLTESHLNTRTAEIKFFQKLKLAKAAYELKSINQQVNFNLTELFNDSEITFLMEKALGHTLEKQSRIQDLIDLLVQEFRKKLFSKPCDKKWTDLMEIGKADEKFCLDCSKAVFKVSTELEMKTRAHLGHCVSLNTINLVDDKSTKFYACYLIEENKEEIWITDGMPF